MIKEIKDTLDPKLASLVRRARNHKSASKPKNADPVIYKWATAFEALIGYLYLSGQTERAVSLVKEGMKYAEEQI